MVRFNDKSQILDSDISNNDIIPITDMDAPEDDKKITVGQLKSFISGGQGEKANVDFTNTKMITDSIISAPNGIFEASNNNQAITVKSELQLVFADGRDGATGRYAIAEHITSQDITQSIITLSDGIYELFLTNNDTILFIDTNSVYVSEDAPQIIEENAYWYNLIDNYWKATSNYGQTWTTANIASLGTVEIANNRVASTKPNQLLGIISFEVFKKMTQQEQRPSALEICDIGTALYVDESKGLRRYLNGSILNINNNTKAFVERLKEIRTTNPDYFTTEENWQNEATENIDGCVYKFVIDEENGTVRLPKYPEYVEINEIGIGGTIPVVGNGMALGLTNGTDNYGLQMYISSGHGLSTSSASYGANANVVSTTNPNEVNGYYGVTTDATKSGLIVDASESVKQTRLKLRYFIQISTGVEAKADIINEIQLNNPTTIFDFKWSDHVLNNLSWLRSDTFSWQSGDVYVTAYNKLVEEYATGTEETEGSITFKQTDNDFKIADISQEQAIMDKYNTDDIAWFYILDTTNRRFKLPRMKYKYWKNQSTLPVIGNGMTLGLQTIGSTNINFGGLQNYNGATLVSSSVQYGQPVGNPYSNATANYFSSTHNGSIGITTDATKSGIVADVSNATSELPMYLYFYVGETVQNAKLIDVGRTNEVLNNKVDTATLKDVSIVVETYIDPDTPTNGYRIWSDGWCEQWGEVPVGTGEITISYIKTFKDVNYCWLNGSSNNSSQNITFNRDAGYNRTVNGFTTIRGWYGSWKASGYLAEGEY